MTAPYTKAMRFANVLGIVLSILTAISNTATADDVHVFYGELGSVDTAARTFRIKTGSRVLVFHYTDQTKLSSFREHVSWDKLQGGQGATVVMRLAEGNIGLALRVRLDGNPGAAKALSLLVARTTGGATISGVAVANYILHETSSEAFVRATGPPARRDGVFVLSVQPDGSVGKVTAAKSLGSDEMNQRAAHLLRQWRFKPNTVTQVQVPIGVGGAR